MTVPMVFSQRWLLVEKHYFATNRIESLIQQLDGAGFPSRPIHHL
jgi:hypothetical protein